MKIEERLPLALLLLRLGVFVVLVMWTLDKFVHPEHAAKIFGRYYHFTGLNSMSLSVLGAVEMAFVVGFVLGFKKRWTYGIVLIIHTVSTLAAFANYLEPFQNLLYFAGWPMLAACFTLYYLRDADTLWTIERMKTA